MNEQTVDQEFAEQKPKNPLYKKYWVGAAVVICIILAMALFGGGDAIQDDLLDYINNDCVEMIKLDAEVHDLYEKARSSANDYAMYTILSNEVIPQSQELRDEAEGLEIETKEVKAVHELYIDSINKQHQAFTLMLSALENQDYVVLTQANEKLDESKKLMRDYETALKDLAKEHDVKFKQ